MTLTHLTTDQTAADGGLTDVLTQRVGRRRFVQGVGATVGAGAIASVLPSSPVKALPTGASSFATLATAVRVVDTRTPNSYTFQRIAPNQIRLKIAGAYGVPAAASALVATVTAVNPSDPNFVTVFPSGGSVPKVSNLNLPFPGATTANLVTVKVGANGSVDIFSRVPCEMIFDVIGYYAPVDGPVRSGRFIGLDEANRAYDSRPNLAGSRSVTVVDLSSVVPSDASSAVINLTATECTGPGYCTVFPFSEGERPKTSSLNFTAVDETRASAVIVPVSNIGGKRQIKIFTLTAAKLIVDVTGYYTGEESNLSQVGLFVPLEPQRILDTREPGQMGTLWPKWVVEAKVPGAAGTDASAIVVNLTGTLTRGPGFLTMSAARQPIPGTSNVNWTSAGATVPNHVITPITSVHGVQVYSSHGAAVLIDLAGYFTGTPKLPRLAAYVNPPPPPIDTPWIIRVPRMGLNSWVYSGDPKAITDGGNTWHWTGTGVMGQNAHVAVFGHRSEAGAPYWALDTMRIGDEFYVDTGDFRRYTYRMVRRDLTDSQNENILDATRFHPAPSLSIIACTVGYDSRKSRYPDPWAPTSLRYRIVVTGELIKWESL